MMNLRVATFGYLRRLVAIYLGLAVTAVVVLAGAAAMIEMVYHLQLNAALGPELTFLGVSLDAKGATSWLGAIALMVIGLLLFEFCRRKFTFAWGQIQEKIEEETRRREAA